MSGNPQLASIYTAAEKALQEEYDRGYRDGRRIADYIGLTTSSAAAAFVEIREILNIPEGESVQLYLRDLLSKLNQPVLDMIRRDMGNPDASR